MKDSDDLGYTPDVRDVESVRGEANQLSSSLLDVIALKGDVTQPGPGVAVCGDRDADKFYKIHHPWSLRGVPFEEMSHAMERLKAELPKRGWKVVKYGPDSSPSRSLELIANSTERKFSVNVSLYDGSKAGSSEASSAKEDLLMVDLVSACFRVPEGKTAGY
ncbi:hypothetical protein [Streptomyces blastmyceticus]|uniref:Uncharacterized protein n=1 Tax=Streptomyces blastmyceticus TaxID=68180 RepID=A0ABN0WAV4_9ACTN